MWEREKCGRERSVGEREVWEREKCGRERSVGEREVWERERTCRREGIHPSYTSIIKPRHKTTTPPNPLHRVQGLRRRGTNRRS